MAQRHEHDSAVTLPWTGFSDPSSLLFVPVELRATVASVPPVVERKMVKELSKMTEVVATDARGKTHTLQPADNDDDLAACLTMRKNAWARTKLAGEQVAVEQARRDALGYTCQACTEVVPPSAYDHARHTQRRSLRDGSTIVVCGKCAAVAEQLATERLAGDRIDGKTRRDRVQALIAAATS